MGYAQSRFLAAALSTHDRDALGLLVRSGSRVIRSGGVCGDLGDADRAEGLVCTGVAARAGRP